MHVKLLGELPSLLMVKGCLKVVATATKLFCCYFIRAYADIRLSWGAEELKEDNCLKVQNRLCVAHFEA